MSIFNSTELKKSVSEGVSELDGKGPEVDMDRDDIKDLKREVNKLRQRHEDMSEALDQASEEPMPVESSEEDSEEKVKPSFGGQSAAPVSREEFEELKSKMEENQKLRQRIEELEEELEEVRSMTSTAAIEEKVDRTHFEDRVDELENKIEDNPDLESKLEDIEIEEKVDRSRLEEEVESLKEEIQEDIGSMENRIEEETPDKSEIGSIWASLEMLEDRIEALKKNTPDRNEFEDKIETMDSKVKSIKNEFSGIESSIETLESQENVTEQEFHEELEEFRRDLNEEVSEFDDKITSKYATSKEVSSLWDALKQLEDRQDDSEEIIDEIDEQGVNQFGRLKDTTKYLEHKIQDLEALEDKVSEIDMLKQKLEDVEMIVEGMDKEAVGKEEYKDLMQDVIELSELTKTIAKRNQ